MTDHLYYHDSYLKEFDAHVLSCAQAESGYAVTLDRTAFYPTSGGQPFDTGRLGEAVVTDVREEESGAILHVTDRPVSAGPVRGVIDWERRFDHMQQHTGQHLLSAAFVQLFKFQTVSFHLGREVSTIDLESRSVVARHVEEAENLTNHVIFDNRALNVSFLTREELLAAGVRKDVNRQGSLRVVEIPDFDRQPCGGTHVGRTGEVGLILLRKLEKVKQNWRVEFVCGFRALAASRGDFATLTDAARLFSCGLPDVPGMVQKVIAEGQASHRSRQKLLEQLAEYESLALVAAAEPRTEGKNRIVVRAFDDAEPAYLRLLATKLKASPGVIALLATRAGGHLVFAQFPGLSADMNSLLRAVLSTVGGKGGGTKEFAQGTVSDPSRLPDALILAQSRLS